MSDKKNKIVKKSTIKSVLSYYENVMVVQKNGDCFYLDFETLTEILKRYDFDVVKKRVRSWGTPIFNKK